MRELIEFCMGLIVELLQSVTLELSPGKLTALVGPSGGGKTSCVCLLQRFYEPQEGEVLLDGEPLYQYQHQYLHKKARSDTPAFITMLLEDKQPILLDGLVKCVVVCKLIHHSLSFGLGGNGIPGSCAFLWLGEI